MQDMENNKLKGRRVLGQLRCSLKEKAKKSLEQQHEWLSEYTVRNGATYVGEMKEAISASQTKRRPDLDRIFERKRTQDDFDTVLVQDLSRLTRGGTEHGLKLYFKFKEMNIQIASVVDGLIDSEDKLIEAARRFQEARATANRNALGQTRGRVKARRTGRIAYTAIIPFGLDKLITDEKGVPRCRLRQMRDGTQQVRSPDGKAVLRTYPKAQHGSRSRFVKQPDEYERLVEGEAAAANLVRSIFRWYFVEGMGWFKIAKKLNDRGELSPRGCLWGCATVARMLENSIYVGEAPCGRISTSLFWECGPTSPIPKDEYEGPLAIYRSQDRWIPMPQPQFNNFLHLDAATVAKVIAWQKERAERRAAHKALKRGGDKYGMSRFLFKRILRTKQEGYYFIGVCSLNRQKKLYSRYAVSRALFAPKKGSPFRFQVRMETLHDAVLPAIREVITSYTGIGSAVRAAVAVHRKNRTAGALGYPKLLARRSKLLAQIEYWVKKLGNLGTELVDEKVKPLQEELGQIVSELRTYEQPSDVVPSEKQIKSAERLIRDIVARWGEFPNDVMRSILQILIKKMEIDVYTKEIELELHLPSWAISRSDAIKQRLENNSVEGTVFETHAPWVVFSRKMQFSLVKEGRAYVMKRLTDAPKAKK